MASAHDEPVIKKQKLELDANNSKNSSEIKELDAGIYAYISPEQKGFSGMIKNRWEDFIVNEIDNEKSICRLSTIVPIEVDSSHAVFSEDKILPIEIDEVLKEIDLEIVFEASFPASDDKHEREIFHKAIKFNYPSLCSKTTEVDGNRFVLVTKSVNAKGKKGWQRSDSIIDPPRNKPFCHFTLYKEGKDTMNALHVIGRMLMTNSNSFTYAGTKDRRAITTQRVCIKNISSKKLASLNPRLHGMKVGNFIYQPYPLSLGDLYGNKFSIAIRDVNADEESIHKAISHWKKFGFINYFGLQRFGHSVQARTFEIGKHIIRSDWEKAIDLILKPTGIDSPVVRQVKERFIKTRNAKACGDDIPQCLEKTLLLGIARHGKSLNALQTLPRNLRQLYLHSFQSLVWNRVASRRVDELGLNKDSTAAIGDLFFPTAIRSVDSASELYFDDAINSSCVPDDFVQPKSDEVPLKPSIVSKDVDPPSIYQVVLPLPGFDVVYPLNESGTWYSEILEEDSLKLEDLRHKVKDFSLPGSYRHLIVKPEDVHYTITEYTDPNEPLIESDLHSLSSSTPLPHKNIEKTDDVQHASHINGKKRAVVIDFILPKAAYATMAIRELMKDVSVTQ